jgi:D-inositol-3-phosphate glycosyltransferase
LITSEQQCASRNGTRPESGSKIPQNSASGKRRPDLAAELLEVGHSQSRRRGAGISDCQTFTFSRVTLLTGGGDKPYALGLAEALTAAGVIVDFIGSDELDAPELVGNPRVNFLNLRGNQCPQVSRLAKMLRVLKYYLRLIHYATTAEPTVFHILWNNKFEVVDRTLLMLYYKMIGKRLLLTAHNVNTRKRDGTDSFLNRLSLRIQYKLSDHIFVHSKRMKAELISEFYLPKDKVSVIPFGINNTVPNTALSPAGAKRQLGINEHDKTLLFFGNIAPYKGLELLVAAFSKLAKQDSTYRLIIAGRIKGCEQYWREIEQAIALGGIGDRIILRIEFIPDEQVELYFKAADVLMLPYTRIFQSGVLFLGYSFGLPAIATDVGSLKDDVIEGETGFLCRANDPDDLADTIGAYFASDSYTKLETRRNQIQHSANERNSWGKVAETVGAVYRRMLLAKSIA